MTFNIEKCNELLKNRNTAVTLRVFFFLALNQHEKTGFVRMSRKTLAQILNLNPKSLYKALKELIGSFLVHQRRCKGYYEFMVSPYYVQFGSDNKARLEEWNKRWAEYWKRCARKK